MLPSKFRINNHIDCNKKIVARSDILISPKTIFPLIFKKFQLYKKLFKLNFSSKILQTTRVTKVVKGGKILRFRALVIVGNKNGKVGFGIGKAEDVAQAIEKAISSAKKKIIALSLTKHFSLPRMVKAAFGASEVFLIPAALGTGIIAGGPVKAVLELGGCRNMVAKENGSKNLINNIKATFFGLIKCSEIVETYHFNSKKNQQYYSKIMNKMIRSTKNQTVTAIFRLISKIKTKIKPMKERIKLMKERIKPIKKRIKPIKEKIKPIKEKISAETKAEEAEMKLMTKARNRMFYDLRKRGLVGKNRKKIIYAKN